MTNTYKITLTSGGKSVEISPLSDAKLLENGLSGFGTPGYDVKICPYASVPGGYAERRRFGERRLKLTFEIGGASPEEIKRELISLLDPSSDIELDIEMYGVHRKIIVIPSDAAEFVRPTLYDSITATLYFVSPAVFFSEHEAKLVKFRDAVPLLTFPLTSVDGAGFTSGFYKTTNSAEINNTGDAGCGIIVTIKASLGEIVNPGISCGGKYVKCNMTLSGNDVLVIETRAMKKGVTLNGERYLAFDRDSTFFALPAGESTVSITCDSGGEYIDAEVEYTPLYYGV